MKNLLLRLFVAVAIGVLAKGAIAEVFLNHQSSRNQKNGYNGLHHSSDNQNNDYYFNKTRENWRIVNVGDSPLQINAPGEFVGKISTIKNKIENPSVSNISEYALDYNKPDFMCQVAISTIAQGADYSLEFGAAGLIRSLKNKFSTAQVIEDEKVSIGKVAARKILVQFSVGSKNLTSSCVLFYTDRKFYLVSLVYNRDNDLYLEQANNMINSIRLKH